MLKDDAWMTVVFHNSSSRAWTAIQSSIACAGFEIALAGTFDKKHGTFKMFVSDNAVGYDLILHCRKSDRLRPDPLTGFTENDLSALRVSAEHYVETSLKKKHAYRQIFLHVDRKSELDYRKLYSEWLAAAIGTRSHVALGFEESRSIVDHAVSRMKG